LFSSPPRVPSDFGERQPMPTTSVACTFSNTWLIVCT
jgi:hypothetical protein